MIKFPTLPPSIALILGLFIGLGIGTVSAYFYVSEHLNSEISKAELETVLDGEKAANEIKQETEYNKQQSKALKEKVKSGESHIVEPNKQRFTGDYVIQLQSKVERIKSFLD